MTKVFIMQGVSGSGKSTWIRSLFNAIRRGACDDFSNVHVVSADHAMYEEDGSYVFTPERQALGHRKCLKRFATLLAACEAIEARDAIVVDNTNTRAIYMEPYIALAQAYGVDIEIISCRAPVEVCIARNAGRAPANIVKDMADAIDLFTKPGHWGDIPMTIIRTQ